MILVNTSFITGREFDVITLVRGAVVQAKHIGKDILAGFRNIAGGEIIEYTEMMNEAREIATARMIEDAQKYGADAIVNVKYTTAEISQGTAEVLAYGTAVKFK
ncbi:UPF0145 protein [Christensenellaceae bacterium]|nr:UPF0145 protein [Christensenellaceae bacterium]BDF60129.1 UPF0145 protein [Christensenellaceae bacterium]